MYNKISNDRKKYLKNIRREKRLVIITQILLVIFFVAGWEILANIGVIDSFIASQPSRILKTFMNLTQNELLHHVGVTCFETVVGFSLGTILGILVSIILWWSNFLSKVAEPFLVVLNSLPKIALRTCNNYMGRSRNACNYSSSIIYFINCNNIRNIKWIYKYRQRKDKNGKNI